jgi:hypothetical protein
MQKGSVEADRSSIGKKEVEDKSKSISTFRHFDISTSRSALNYMTFLDISTSRSALNYFYGNNFDNDQNAISKYATDLPSLENKFCSLEIIHCLSSRNQKE